MRSLGYLVLNVVEARSRLWMELDTVESIPLPWRIGHQYRFHYDCFERSV